MTRPLDKEFTLKGFLAADIDELRPRLRDANAVWFAIAEKASDTLNQCVARAMQQENGSSMSPGVLATLIGARACGNFQGAIILASHGMDTEARTLIRSCVEAAICLAILHEDPDHFSTSLKIDDDQSRRAQAKFILENKFISEAEEEERLQSILDTIAAGRNLPNQRTCGERSIQQTLLILSRLVP